MRFIVSLVHDKWDSVRQPTVCYLSFYDINHCEKQDFVTAPSACEMGLMKPYGSTHAYGQPGFNSSNSQCETGSMSWFTLLHACGVGLFK